MVRYAPSINEWFIRMTVIGPAYGHVAGTLNVLSQIVEAVRQVIDVLFRRRRVVSFGRAMMVNQLGYVESQRPVCVPNHPLETQALVLTCFCSPVIIDTHQAVKCMKHSDSENLALRCRNPGFQPILLTVGYVHVSCWI